MGHSLPSTDGINTFCTLRLIARFLQEDGGTPGPMTLGLVCPDRPLPGLSQRVPREGPRRTASATLPDARAAVKAGSLPNGIQQDSAVRPARLR